MSKSVWIIEFRRKKTEYIKGTQWRADSSMCYHEQERALTKALDWNLNVPSHQYRAVEYIRKEQP